ncbi:MAG: hypothetical protein BAJALOKI2v1_420016 [Promethearchaeota archaeon]|nr:MAG: hypothetical protein BAJALOKI2v1_420016 [Candidatus Lokiarchaeota archaeon]
MKDIDKVLALFYSDENNLVFDTIKYNRQFSKEQIHKIESLPFRFLGPVFFKETNPYTKNWIINLVESSITLNQDELSSPDIIQSCFLLNSSKIYGEELTNLFCLVVSPFTENIELIESKMKDYIHPSILQGRRVKEHIHGEEFDYKTFIGDELRRGINLVEFSLGTPRKQQWRLKKKYFCVGVIKRTNIDGKKYSELYTIDTDYIYKELVLDYIPSFYIMSILPDYYEKSMNEALEVFEKTTVKPHIQIIKIHQRKKVVLYLEEYKTNKNDKTSYGVILIPEAKKIQYLKETSVFVPQEKIYEIPKELSFYKKALRQLLDDEGEFIDTLRKFNPNINPVDSWPINSEENLEEIQEVLDIKGT